MSKRDKYAPDYHKLYPGVEFTPAVMHALDQSDRKMQYFELDLKTGRRRKDAKAATTAVIPAREDSLERLEETHEQHYLLEDASPEQALIEQDELERLRCALKRLEPEERELVKALFFDGKNERQYAESLGITQQAVSYRIKAICRKLKKYMEK